MKKHHFIIFYERITIKRIPIAFCMFKKHTKNIEGLKTSMWCNDINMALLETYI